MSASRVASAALKIPKRIERGPTDILRALASTVKYLPEEPSTAFHDDPHLMPRHKDDRMLFPLATISGRNTAKFLLNKHPELFYRDDAEPKVRAFHPPEEYREDMRFDLSDLKWCIDNDDSVNGIIAYKSLIDGEDVEIDDELLLQLFELICYTNEDPMLDQIAHEKAFYTARNTEGLPKQNWKLTGIASKIFNEIKQEKNPPRVYSAMIAGLIKHNEHQVAKEIFEEFKEFFPEKGLFANAYRFLISSVPSLYSSQETAHQEVENLVSHMEEHLVAPNLGVFNSILDVYRRFDCDLNVCKKASQLIVDMRALKIKPSPFSYMTLLRIIKQAREAKRHPELIESLLEYMATNDHALEIRDERDVEVLTPVMCTLAGRLHNSRWASQLYRIYLKKPTLFEHVNAKNLFLNVYFRLMINTEGLETILKFYDNNVPMQFRPDSETFDLLVEALDIFDADEETIKRIGQDLARFRLADRIKDDTIFRKDPEYVAELERQLNGKPKWTQVERRMS